jgi:hypothetical protein
MRDHGRVRAMDASGRVHAMDASGRVRAMDASGRVRAMDASGRVGAMGASGRVRAMGASGRVGAMDARTFPERQEPKPKKTKPLYERKTKRRRLLLCTASRWSAPARLKIRSERSPSGGSLRSRLQAHPRMRICSYRRAFGDWPVNASAGILSKCNPKVTY